MQCRRPLFTLCPETKLWIVLVLCVCVLQGECHKKVFHRYDEQSQEDDYSRTASLSPAVPNKAAAAGG